MATVRVTASSSERGDEVALLLRRLCQQLIGGSGESSTQRVERALRYSARILASGLVPASGVCDEASVCEAIRRDLQHNDKANLALR